MVNITDVLNQWADIGVFAYVLPFLMIFAVVYGILTKSGLLGENKGVNTAIALSVGLLALQFDYVSIFFASIFPMAGIGLSVLLVALILIGLFAGDDSKVVNVILLVLGIIIFLVILLTSFYEFSWWGGLGYGWSDSLPAIVVGVVIIAVIGAIVFGGGNKGGKKDKKD